MNFVDYLYESGNISAIFVEGIFTREQIEFIVANQEPAGFDVSAEKVVLRNWPESLPTVEVVEAPVTSATVSESALSASNAAFEPEPEGGPDGIGDVQEPTKNRWDK